MKKKWFKKKNLEHQKGRNNLVTKNIGNLGISEITKLHVMDLLGTSEILEVAGAQ